MTPAEVLHRVQEDAKLWRVQLRRHAREQMDERNVQDGDVREAAMTATAAEYDKKRDTWRLTGGRDLDGGALTLVIALEPTRLVTVFVGG